MNLDLKPIVAFLTLAAFGLVLGLPTASATASESSGCTVNSGECSGGNCFANTGWGYSGCRDGGSCAINQGHCSGGGRCLVNLGHCE